MDQPHRSSGSANRGTIGEALIAVTALAGFLACLITGKLWFTNLWSYALLLGLIVIFYFALLFARMFFYWMTGGDQYPWWDKMKEWDKK